MRFFAFPIIIIGNDGGSFPPATLPKKKGTAMNWTDLKITVNTKDAETAEAIAQLVVPYGIYIEDYSDMLEMVPEIAHIDLIDEELLARKGHYYDLYQKD